MPAANDNLVIGPSTFLVASSARTLARIVLAIDGPAILHFFSRLEEESGYAERERFCAEVLADLRDAQANAADLIDLIERTRG